MNPLLHWLTSPEWTHIVGALLHSLWQGAAIALALAVLLRRLANPVTRYRCALVTLSLVIISGIVTWALLNAPKSGAFSASPIPVIKSTLAPVAPAALNSDSADIIVAAGTRFPPPAPKYWIAALALVWVFGAAVMMLRAGLKVAGAEKLRRSCQPLQDQSLVTLVAEARRAVGLVRQIRVAVTDQLTSPAVVGVIVPTLILPLSLFTALTPEQIRFILLHELAHIRRGDYFANLFQLFAEALLFFNPAVWWISHQIRREREASCDALAIELSGAPADYARTLVRVAENIMQPATNAALAFGDGQRETSSLTDRVHRLLVPGYRPALRLTWRAMLASLIVGGTLLVLSALGTRNTVGAILSPRATTTTINPDASKTNAVLKKDSYTVTQLAMPVTNAKPSAAAEDSDLGDYDSSSHGKSSGIATISNGGRIKFGDQELTADFIEFDQPTGKLIERGNVRLQTTNSTVVGDEIIIHTKTNSGVTFEPEHGLVVVRATDADLDRFESAIKSLLATNSSVTARGGAATSRATALATRTFAVGPVEMARALGHGGPVEVTNAAAMVQELMVKAGVDLQPPKTVVFKDSLGLLLVRASEAELDAIASFLVHVNLGAAATTLPRGKTDEASEINPIPKKAPATSSSDGSTNFHLRVFAVDANALSQILAKQHGTNANLHANPTTDGSLMIPDIRKLFASVGVDLQPPKTMLFNEPKGQLLVRATQADLDTIEQVLEVLNDQPPQINIKVKFVEIPQPLVGPMLQEFLTNALVPSSSRTESLSSFLTEKQMAEVRKRIDAKDGMTLLSEGDVTTLSGRQCQIQTVEMNTIVTGINPKALTRPGVASTNHTGSAFLETELTPFGPILDVIPTVSRDQADISLRVIATLTEFLGYDKVATEVPIYVNDKQEKTTLPLPKYQLQQMTNDCVILDGQTLMLGNLSTTEVAKQPNGEFLTTDVSSSKTNSLFVFITPTLIDPAGNRVNPVRKSPSF